MLSDWDLQGASYCSNVIPRQLVWVEEIPTLCDLGSRDSRVLSPVDDSKLSLASLQVGAHLRSHVQPTTAQPARLRSTYIRMRFPVGVHIADSWIFPAVSGPQKQALNMRQENRREGLLVTELGTSERKVRTGSNKLAGSVLGPRRSGAVERGPDPFGPAS